MSLSKVLVDFHNADEQGRLRLNFVKLLIRTCPPLRDQPC